MATLVVGDVNYGSTHDEELVVPLTLMDHNRTNTKHSSSNPSWKTKKLMCAGIIGMTAAVASSALLFLSVTNFSNQDSTEPSFLIHAIVGADDNFCVPASGPWPTGAVSRPGNAHSHFVTCFVSTTGGYCWFHSYYNSETWNACTPYGFDENMWSIHSPHENDFWVDDDKSGDLPVETCGTPCTEFLQGLSPLKCCGRPTNGQRA